MGNYIQDAGWGFWPVAFFGIVGLVVAVRNVMAPTRERLPLIVGLVVATLLLGMLGTVTGLQASARYLEVNDATPRIFLLGMRESLNNMALALILSLLQVFVGAYGGYRRARQASAARPAAT
jgi:hypothetical protein